VNTLMLITTDSAAVIAELDEARNVASLMDIKFIKQLIQKELDESFGPNMAIFAIIGLGVAFGIIFSTASITLSERSREYATMRVLGHSPGQIGLTLMLEYLLLSIIAIAPGIPIAFAIRWMVREVMIGEVISLTLRIDLVHFIVGGALCLLASALAILFSIRSIARMEMAHVLKERE
jgi:putative ABC transport system permease protein